MGKRGPKPKWREFVWSPNLAYAVGLFATDGCLYNDGRHLSLVSQDIQQLENFKQCLGLDTKISFKSSDKNGRRCPHVQLSDVALYRFFLEIGLTPNKSKTMGVLEVPPRYFFDFLRGVFDGDGSFYSYYDPRWKSSFVFYTSFASASPNFISWVRREIKSRLLVRGHITNQNNKSCSQLRYAKADSLKIIKRMYYDSEVVCLMRKRKKIEKALKINILTK